MMRPPAADARLPRMATKPRATRRPPATPPTPSEESSQRQPPTEPPAKTFKFPTAFTVLAIVLLLVWIASFFVPAGKYATNAATGGPQPGTYHKLPNCSVDAGARLRPPRRRVDHLPRRGLGCDRLDCEPLCDRRRLGRSRHHDRRRYRIAHRAVGRPRHECDRLRHLVRAARARTSSEVDRRGLGE